MNITGKRIIQKILAILVILTMTMAELTMVGVNLISYAVDQVEVNNANVGFNVYFQDENKSLETTATLDKGDLKLAIEVNVKKDGYLANGKIELDQAANFKFKSGTNNSYVSKVEDNAIYLKQINEGETAVIDVEAQFLGSEEIDLDYLSRTSKMSLSGTYVNSKNVKKEQKVEIDGSAEVKINWKSPEDTGAILTADLLTNSTLTVDNSNKKVVQLLISSYLKNNSYPVKNTNIELDIPGEPESVTVHKRTTNATNGDREFNGGKYENGKLTINVANGQDNKISWKKGTTDQFVVTLTYPENAEIDGSKVSVNSTLITYDEKTLVKDAELNIEGNVEELVSVSQAQNPKEISKGDLYAGQEKAYTTVTKMYVDYPNAVTGIELNAQKSVFVEGEDEKTANVEYVQTSINKQQFTEMFGEEGTLEVKDQKGDTVQVVTKESEVDKNGNIVVKYDAGVTNISVTTSNPVSEGTLEIRDEEKISKGYSREDLAEVSALKDSKKVVYTKNTENTSDNNSESLLRLKETSSKASLKVDPLTLSTSGGEQELHLTAVLETDNENRDLFKNPEIKITLPKQLQKVKAEGKLLYGNGLELEDFKVSHDDNNMFITAKLSGEQTSYPGDAVKEAARGAVLDIVAKVQLNKLAPSSTEEIKLNYTNENATKYADNGEQKVKVNIVSESSMILTNDISEYNISTLNNEGTKQVSLATNAEAKEAKVTMQVVNNEDGDISNVAVLGKIANLKGKIDRTSAIRVGSKDMTVYYTTVENPTADLKDAKNAWTKENLAEAKNYLILVDKIEQGNKVNFGYNIKVQKDLTYNINAETGYTVSYTNTLTGKQNKAESTKLLLTTGSVAELSAKLTAQVGGEELKQGSEVKAGEIITYAVTVLNTGKEKAEGVTLTATIPENTTLLQYNSEFGKGNMTDASEDEDPNAKDEFFIEKLERQLNKENITIDAGKAFNIEYMVKVNADITESKEIEAEITAKYKDKVEKASMKNTIKPATIQVTLTPLNRERGAELEAGYPAQYGLTIYNLTDNEQKNVQITINKNDLLGEIQYLYSINDQYKNAEINMSTFTIDSIPAKSTVQIEINSIVKLPTNNLNRAEISATVRDDKGNEYTSNKLIEEVTGINVVAELSSTGKNKDEYAKPGDEITYTIKVKNIGEKAAEELKIEDQISDYLELKSVSLNGKEIQYDRIEEFGENVNYSTLVIKTTLKSKEEMSIEIKANVLDDIKTEQVLKIVNKAKIYNNILLVETDEDVHYLEPTVEPETPGKDDKNNKGYIISGRVWMDANQNGTRDSEEQFVQGVQVYAINVSTNKVVKEATTAEDGSYTFTALEKGEYIVAFKYDTEKYVVTLYQANGVAADKNSDAVRATKLIDGEERTLAITDSIDLNESKANIDLGLAEAKVFDLDLEKVISKMVVTNSEGTKTYEFEDTDLAKTEIRSKNLNGSNVVIEYKMKITNNGEVAGYAKRIVDYIPSSLKFNSNLNKDWYQKGEYIYNSSLANTKIEPGETKEITLVLTKTMTESNTGLTNNKAEIESSYNNLGIEDVDTASNNTEENKDKKGSADALITPSTGEATNFIVLTITTIVLICGAAYLVNKKILLKKLEI